MNMDMFTPESRKIIFEAKNLTKYCGQYSLEPDHLLIATLRSDDEGLTNVFGKLEIDIENVCEMITQRLPKRTTPEIKQETSIHLSRQSELIIKKAILEADNMLSDKVRPQHILLSLSNATGQISGDIIRSRGLMRQNILQILNMLETENKKSKLKKNEAADVSHDGEEDQDEADPLKKYCQDLLAKAKANKFDPVIGRDEEIRRVIQVLLRRTKNNPVLIGQPGVGKTAVIEGLAQRIVAEDVPESLKNMGLFALDLTAMIAGAKYRGDFEDRLKQLLEQIESYNRRIILFIDELHTLVGAGATQGAMDASNMLKPALARGELRCVGATTIDEYKKYIEKDQALARRFQKVIVDEPDTEVCIAILRGIKEKYEVHHGVRIKDSAIVSSVKLSQRYIVDRYLPDKALDLIDESASKLRIEIDSLPTELDSTSRRITQLEIEKTALSKETDLGSSQRLKEIEKNVEALKSKYNEFKEQWDEERYSIREIKNLKENIEKFRLEEMEAVRQGDLEKAAKIKYGNLDELERKLKELNSNMDASEKGRILREEVDEEDIGAIISKSTGIPLDKMLTKEREKLLMMEKCLLESLIGQNQAVKTVSNSIRRARAGIQDPNRPWGCFIFMGPTGVGKTELVKSLAEFLFNDSKAIIRLDMSEYTEKHTVSRLLGSPPGYVGYDEGGLLSEVVRHKPYSVVLFDEIEKAHPEIFNILLQILDEGRVTDAKGTEVNFRNTIIILTTNIGSQILLKNGSDQDLPLALNNELSKYFKPEFINRIDDVVPFFPLGKSAIREIVRLQIGKLIELIQDQKIEVNLTDAAESYLAETGYSPEFGARPVKRVIQREIQDPLAYMILDESIKENSKVLVDFTNNKLRFEIL